MEYPRIGVGIDPAWKTCGFAIVRELEEGIRDVLHSEMINVSELPNPWSIGSVLLNKTFDVLRHYQCFKPDVTLKYPMAVGIERFVSYKGIDTGNQEEILMVIGNILGGLNQHWPVHMYKAFDWKRDLNKHLFKTQDFRNPSTNFDKKFSIAAAKACVMNYDTYPVLTNHEADAIGIATRSLLELK